MARESKPRRLARARRIAAKLYAAHPDARCALDFGNPFELLCATVLSAQCTDERVNRVTPALFARYGGPASLAAAPAREVEKLVKSTGFYKSKTKSLMGLSRALVESHGGKVPDDMERLVELPGVGRKTANVILGTCYKTPGIVVDTHVSRVSQRLELTANTDPEKIEADLMELIERTDWTRFSHAMIFHGRRICVARKPRCYMCPLFDDCPYPKQVAATADSPPAARKASSKAAESSRVRARHHR